MDSSDLTKFRRNRVASNSHNGQKATRPANKITQMSSGLLMDLIMGSRRVVNGNTTILPNCGGTNGAGCNQDLIVEDDGEVILEPPNEPLPFWAASVLTDRANLRPISITTAPIPSLPIIPSSQGFAVFAVDGYAPSNPPTPVPPNKFISRIFYYPSISTQTAPTGNPTGSAINNSYYRYYPYFNPGSVVYRPSDGRIYTFEYFDANAAVTNLNFLGTSGSVGAAGLYLISLRTDSINANQNDLGTSQSTVIVYSSCFISGGPLPPSSTNPPVYGSAMTVDTSGRLYYLTFPNSPTGTRIASFDPSTPLTSPTDLVVISGLTQTAATNITGMRVYNNYIFYTFQQDGTVRSADLLGTLPTNIINIIAGTGSPSGTNPPYPPSGPVLASQAEFDPSDIEIIEPSLGVVKMYIADGRNNRVLITDLNSFTTASLNTTSLFAGCQVYPNTSPTINGNFNNPAQVNTPGPPIFVPALGETPSPATNPPPFSYVPANSANLAAPVCLCKIPFAPSLTSVGPTQILVGTFNTYAPPVTTSSYGHLPLMLLKYYY